MNKLIKLIERHSKQYPFISMDFAGYLYLSKVPNVVLNEKQNNNDNFKNENTKIIATKNSEDEYFTITDSFEDLLYTHLHIWIGGFSTDAIIEILFLLSDMSQNEDIKTKVLSIFKA